MNRPKSNLDVEFGLQNLEKDHEVKHVPFTYDMNSFEVASEESEHGDFPQVQDQEINKKSAYNPSTHFSNNSKSGEFAEKQPFQTSNHEVLNEKEVRVSNATDSRQPEGNASSLAVGEQPRQRMKSTNYQQKSDLIRLGEASGLRPNLLNSGDNDDPFQLNNGSFTLALRPQEPERQYQPNDQHLRTQKLKHQDTRYSSKKVIKNEEVLPVEQIVASPEKKKKVRRLSSINSSKMSSNLMSLHQSSTIVLNSSSKLPTSRQQPLSEENIQESLKNILQPVAIRSVYQFIRSPSLGAHPNFAIFSSDGTSLISAKKQSCHFNSFYKLSVGTFGYEVVLGTLRGNFGGTEFNLYRLNSGRQELAATIIYKSNFSVNSDFRKMEVYIKYSEQGDLMFEGETKKKNLKELFNEGYTQYIKKLVTKDPTWNEASQCFSLNFGGKGKMPSIKNMILLPENSSRNSGLVFCKSSHNVFHLQLKHSLSVFVTMGILMSSFDFKLFCQ